MHQRNYGIDLFRIVSMIMVVTLHVLGQGGVLASTSGMLDKSVVAWVLETACYGAVNCYALISGYVGINAKHRYTNIIILWFQVVVIIVALRIVQYCLDPSSISVHSVFSSVFPVFTRSYWYFTDYIILFFCMPLLNAGIEALDKIVLRNCLIIIGSIFCISSFFPGPVFEKDLFRLCDGYTFVWLALMYLVGAYIAKYNPFDTVKKSGLIFVYGVCMILAVASRFALDYMPVFIIELIPITTFIDYCSPFIVGSSIALLLLFSRMPTLPKGITLITSVKRK